MRNLSRRRGSALSSAISDALLRSSPPGVRLKRRCGSEQSCPPPWGATIGGVAQEKGAGRAVRRLAVTSSVLFYSLFLAIKHELHLVALCIDDGDAVLGREELVTL